MHVTLFSPSLVLSFISRFIKTQVPRLTAGLLLSIAFCQLSTPAIAQDYPVQVTTTLTPPYSLYLADYASPDRPALQVIINLRELDRPEYKVKLHLTIEGQGITLRTKPSYLPAPIVLQGGLPEILTGDEISHYLNPNNLDFSGISRQDFLKRGTFPEGFYTFKIEAVDYNRGIIVSNAGLANAWIILNDPPLINLPFNNDKVIATDPQNLMFSWTPRHTASPNAAFTSEYEFKLVELYPASRNPNDAILSSNSIYVTTTTSTSLNYGVADPLLIPGRKYAFRLRAYDTDGRDLFKNNGYSEVYVFQFGDACVPPRNVKGEALDDKRIKLTWEGQQSHTSFDFQDRREDRTDWWRENTLSDFAIIPELTPKTTYQYQVRGRCGTLVSEFTTIETVTTKEKNDKAFVCGEKTPPVYELKTTPLSVPLKVGDIIKVSDYEVILETVTPNNNGTYRGTGFTQMPMLNYASVHVKFRNIRVNEDYRLYGDGRVSTIYSTDSRFILNVDLAKDKLKETYQGNPQLQQQLASAQISFPGDIKTITVDPATGNIIVTKEDGTTETIERPKDAAGNIKDAKITDSNGDSWVVGKDGTIQQGPSTAAPASVASMDAVNFNVSFVPNPQQNYGFDAKDEKLRADYESIKIKGQDYTVAWKAVESGRLELVNAEAPGQSTFPTTVGFKTANGTIPSQAATESGQKQAFITGGLANQTEALTAYVRVKEPDKEEQQIEVGRLNVTTYDKILNKLYIVPVNDATTPGVVALNEELNKIFWQAVVGWDVSIDDRFNVDPNILPELAAGMSEMLSPFPPNMLSFNHLFINDPTRFIDNDAYYIFLVDGVNTDKQGFMPFKRKFGYIFLDNTSNVIKAIAHELGHGAFRLHHTFSTDDFRASENSTDNLMDYNGGTILKKYQWDEVHNPQALISWLQDDAESQLLLIDFGFLKCSQRAVAKALKEEGVIPKLLAGAIEGALCATEEDQCEDKDYWTKFSYGLANGIVQQIDVFAIRDAVFEIFKTRLKNQLACLLNGESVILNVNSDAAAKDQLRSIFKCQFGVDVSLEEIQALWDKTKTYVEAHYEDPYLRGQATALILTIVLPPIVKAVQSGKIVQLVSKFKNISGFTAEAANLDRLAAAGTEDVAGVLDDLARGSQDLISNLTGSIKSTYDDLIKAGLKSEVKANSILLKNATGETVAIIYEGKLTPTKWAWQKNFSASSKVSTSEGYIMIKDGKELKFDLGFKEGRKLETKEVNDYLVNGQGKDLDGQPYWAGTQVQEVVLGKEGEIIYFIEDYNNGTPNPGQYGSKDPITTIKELREKLAVKEAWKETAKEPTLRAYKVKSNLNARSGIIGRQSDNGVELPGGWHQFEIMDYLKKDWENYLEPIGSRAGVKLN